MAKAEIVALSKRKDRIDFVHTVGDKKKPLPTLDNLQLVLDNLQAVCRYNVISKKMEILLPGESYTPDNHENSCISKIKSEISKHNMPTSHCLEYLSQIADRNPFNPVLQWIESKEWDEEDRLEALYATVKSRNEELKRIVMLRWLVSCVAAIYEPNGVSASGVLVFQGAENLGKTKWFKRLAEDVAVIAYRQDGMTLDPSNKDSVMYCVKNWLVELGELDGTFRKADLAALKAFITRDRDVLRLAYAQRESEFPRRTLFFASVNGRQYLHDTTGNRRFWTVECDSINHEHTINMQQLWAQVAELYKSNETWHLTPEEYALMFDNNKEYEANDFIKERIIDAYEWDAHTLLKKEWRWLSAAQILIECGIDRPGKGDTTRCGQIISSLNGDQRKRTGEKRLLAVPHLKAGVVTHFA